MTSPEADDLGSEEKTDPQETADNVNSKRRETSHDKKCRKEIRQLIKHCGGRSRVFDRSSRLVSSRPRHASDCRSRSRLPDRSMDGLFGQFGRGRQTEMQGADRWHGSLCRCYLFVPTLPLRSWLWVFGRACLGRSPRTNRLLRLLMPISSLGSVFALFSRIPFLIWRQVRRKEEIFTCDAHRDWQTCQEAKKETRALPPQRLPWIAAG